MRGRQNIAWLCMMAGTILTHTDLTLLSPVFLVAAFVLAVMGLVEDRKRNE